MISNHEVISLLRRTDLGDLSRYQARRLALKASVVGAVLMLAAPASAQFTVSGGVVFNNGSTITDSTTNSNPNAGSNSSSIQSFSSAGGIVGVNTNTGSILGNGLNLDASVGYTVTGSSVTMINNGNIQPSNNVNPALGLTTDGGTITYTGTGSVINVPANGNGIVANASGVFAGVGGAVSITAGGNVSGTEGIVASSNFAGTVTVQTSGNVTALESSTYLLPQYAIDVTTENGNAHVIVDSGTVTGGISSNATGNGNSIVTINGGTVTSVVNSAIVSQALNGLSQVVINGGTLSGANGLAVVNALTNFTGTGGVSVLMHGGEIDGVTNGSSVGINAVNATTSTTGVTVATDAGSKILMAAGTSSNPTTGIFAQSNGTAGGANVTVGGSISGADVGVNASITNTSNSNNAVVTVNGSIDANTTGVIATSNGTGNVQVNGAGSIGSTIHPSLLGVDASITNAGSAGNVTVSVTGPITAGNGVQAFTAGTGSVLVQTGTVTAGTLGAGIGINANGFPIANSVPAGGTPGAGAVTVTSTGPITGFATGIVAGNFATTGAVSVTASGGITSLNGSAVNATGTTGPVTVDTTGGTVQSTGNDVIVATSTTGNIVVKTDAVTQTSLGSNGINANSFGSGMVTVQTNGAVNNSSGSTAPFGTGIFANGAIGTGAVTVIANGAVTNFANGIVAGNGTTTGAVSVTANGGITALAGSAVIATGTSGPVTVDTTGGTVRSTGGNVIAATSTTGNIVVKTDAVTQTSLGFNGINATATGSGSVMVQTNGAVDNVSGSLAPTGTGILADGAAGTGAVTVMANGAVNNFANGIIAGNAATAGPVFVTANSGITALAGNAVKATGTTGPVTVDTTGGAVQSTGGNVVVANSTSGNIVVKTDAVTANSLGFSGVIANASTTGSVFVETNGPVTGAGFAATGTGIIANNTTSTGGATVIASGAVTGFANGIDAGNTAATEPVSVTALSGVASLDGFGVRAQGTTGPVTVDTIGGAVTSNNGDGVIGTSTTGAINIVTAGVAATNGNGINATSTTGGITVISTGAVSSTNMTGIIAVQTGSGPGGDVLVLPQSTVSGKNGIIAAAVSTNNLTVTVSNNVTGTAGNGINATVAAGIANVNVNNPGTTVLGTGSGNSGVVAATGNGGTTNINVTTSTTVTDLLGRGITTTATGSGATNITSTGTIVGAGTSADAVISIGNQTGTVTINNLGPGLIANNAVAVLASNSAVAIATSTSNATGANNINNSGSVIGTISLGAGLNTFTNLGGGQWVVSDGVAAAGGFGAGSNNSLINDANAVIFAGSKNAGSVANFTGLANLSNAGVFYAGNSTTSVTNVNPNAGTTQTVVNTGVINVNGTLNFANLGTQKAGSTFTNGSATAVGVIDMSGYGPATAPDGTAFPASTHHVGDIVTLGTISATGTSDLNYKYVFGPAYNYVGVDGKSFLEIDTNIGGPGSASDRLIISGTASGKTGIGVWDTSSSTGALNLTGITLVAVNGASKNAFFLDGQLNPANQVPGTPTYDLFLPNFGPMGAIQKGFFIYPLLQSGFTNQGGSAQGSRYALFGLPSAEAFQLPIVTTAAQNIWEQTVLGWLDRQDEIRNWMRRGQQIVESAAGSGADLPTKAPLAFYESTGPGVWMKAIGSFTNRDASRGWGDILPAASVLGNVDLSYHQGVGALIGGVDFGHAQLFSPFDALVLGLMGGYEYSDVHFRQSPTSYQFTGGTAGISASYLYGGWFADGLFKADLLDVSMNFPSQQIFGFDGTTVQARNVGGLANFGYRWDWRWALGALYFEPIGTLSYVSTHIGNFDTPVMTANFKDGEAFRGALGLRAGNIWVSTPTTEVDTSITGKFWDQFSTKNGVVLSTAENLLLPDIYAKTFGEVIAQLNITSKGSGWSAYMNTGVQFGSDITSFTGKGGARYQW